MTGESAKSFFERTMPDYELEEAGESKDWALCTWFHDEADGMALLHRGKDGWQIALSSGGVMSATELAIFGVPRELWSGLLEQPFSKEELADAQTALTEPVWAWQTRDKELEAMDLEAASDLELTLMCNEIFALHGHVFEDPYLKATFQTRTWYKPDENFSEDRLTAQELANANFILEFQKGLEK